MIREMCQKLDEKFASPQHAGPTDVVTFMGITEEEEKEQIRQDVYQKIHYLTNKLKTM